MSGDGSRGHYCPAIEKQAHVDAQLNKADNWNHLKAVIGHGDSCMEFDQISVCYLHFLI
jgi:hypothetical protein